MPHLSPPTVARAARALFKSGHAESIAFFYLKAEGAVPGEWTHFTSSNEPPEALRLLARQPDGFDRLVQENLDQFAEANEHGFPTRPGARGTDEDYTMYWPVAEEAQYLLRKDDCNRNAVYSNLTGGRNALNEEKATLEDVIEVRDPDGVGKEARFREDYVFRAAWYYGPAEGEPMRVPLRPIAVWLHRSDELDEDVTIDQLVTRTVDLLHITDEELYGLFDAEYPFDLEADDFVEALSLEEYFSALCLPGDRVDLPPVSVSRRFKEMDREDYRFAVETLGLRSDREETPTQVALDVLDDGRRNLLLFGPPRTGKSYAARDLAAEYLDIERDALEDDPRFAWVQFHQGWSYGDFVRKLVPAGGDGGLEFRPRAGVLLEHCGANRDGRSVLVVEELNRANVADVFGEAFQLLEETYRGRTIRLPAYGDEDQPPELSIPEDLLLVATANDLDRSTLPLDFALLSRFATVEFPVRYDESFGAISRQEGWDRESAESFVHLLKEVEEISGYPIGHAYFYDFCRPEGVVRWYRTELRPALKNYLTEHRKADLLQLDALVEGWAPE